MTSGPRSIDFEDITTEKWGTIPKNYRGLEWNNFWIFKRTWQPDSGYTIGAVTGDYVANNRFGDPCEISSPRPFSVESFMCTAAWNRDLHVLVQSFDGLGDESGKHETTLPDPRDGPTRIDLKGAEGNFQNIHKIKITCTGGESAELNVKPFVKKHRYDKPLSTTVPTHSTSIAIDDLRVY